jgi:hypothetical protein
MGQVVMAMIAAQVSADRKSLDQHSARTTSKMTRAILVTARTPVSIGAPLLYRPKLSANRSRGPRVS